MGLNVLRFKRGRKVCMKQPGGIEDFAILLGLLRNCEASCTNSNGLWTFSCLVSVSGQE